MKLVLFFKSKHDVDFNGIKIHIENPIGSVRSGVDQDGKKWSTKMKRPYGEIIGVDGTDGDPLDVFIGKNKDSEKVFIVHIKHPDGRYDEDKVFLGYDDKYSVKKCFRDHYDNYRKFFGNISEMSLTEFKRHIVSHDGAPVTKHGVLIKSRKPSHPYNAPYKQPSGRLVVRVIGKNGKPKIIPVSSKKRVKPSKSKPQVKPKEKSLGSGIIAGDRILKIRLDKIEAAKGGQIRKRFDKKKLETLAAGIEAAGLIQPIVVRPHPTKKGKFEIIAGERRYRAHKMLQEAGKSAAGDPVGHIQARVVDSETAVKNAAQFQENVNREDNTPMEIGNAIKAAYDSGESFEDIARARGQRIDVIKNHYSLTTLDPNVQEMIERKEIPKKAGFLLAELPYNEQGVFAGKFSNEKWSIRQLDNHIYAFKNQQKLFAEGVEKTDSMKRAEEQLEGADVVEQQAKVREFANKMVSFIDKFITEDGARLSALALAAVGNFDQHIKHFQMIQDKLSDVINRMSATHHNNQQADMFAKSKKDDDITKSFLKLKKDFSILKALIKYRRK